jgi:hypothetical protein
MKYALLLNDMRQPNIENIDVVRTASTIGELEDYYDSHLQEEWVDGPYHKSFTKGSEFEWYNPIHDIKKLNDYWGGIWEVPDQVQVREGLRKA